MTAEGSGGFGNVRLMVTAIGSLFAGAVVAAAALGLILTDQFVGYALAGLLLLAPLPMLAGDLTDMVLLMAVRRHRLSAASYQRSAARLVPVAVVLIGVAVYPVVIAIGGVDLLGVFVVIGALLLFGILPVGSWLLRKLRATRAKA
jgi:hypothetical protein